MKPDCDGWFTNSNPAMRRAQSLRNSLYTPELRRTGWLICPTGGLLTGVSIPLCKNISVFAYPKSLLELLSSRPTRGALAIVTNVGMGCGGRGSVGRAMGSQGGFFESVSDQQHADERRLLRTAKSCGPDAPTLASSSRRFYRPNRSDKT
jgi:hypothetical protein